VTANSKNPYGTSTVVRCPPTLLLSCAMQSDDFQGLLPYGTSDRVLLVAVLVIMFCCEKMHSPPSWVGHWFLLPLLRCRNCEKMH
jgi:hypothetical protein